MDMPRTVSIFVIALHNTNNPQGPDLVPREVAVLVVSLKSKRGKDIQGNSHDCINRVRLGRGSELYSSYTHCLI